MLLIWVYFSLKWRNVLQEQIILQCHFELCELLFHKIKTTLSFLVLIRARCCLWSLWPANWRTGAANRRNGPLRCVALSWSGLNKHTITFSATQGLEGRSLAGVKQSLLQALDPPFVEMLETFCQIHTTVVQQQLDFVGWELKESVGGPDFVILRN